MFQEENLSHVNPEDEAKNSSGITEEGTLKLKNGKDLSLEIGFTNCEDNMITQIYIKEERHSDVLEENKNEAFIFDKETAEDENIAFDCPLNKVKTESHVNEEEFPKEPIISITPDSGTLADSSVSNKSVYSMKEHVDIKYNEKLDITESHEDSKYNCPHCNFSLSHSLYHIRLGGCDATENSRSDTESGNITNASVSEQTKSELFTCILCSKNFSYKEDLMTDLSGVYTEGKYECSLCKEKFDFINNFIKHLNTFHYKSRRICSICNKMFSEKYTLKKNILIVHYEHENHDHCREEKYICDLCNKKYTRKGSLWMHVKHFHHRERRYECNVCNKRFESTSKLNVHMNTVHYKKKEYKCNACKRKFALRHNMMRHCNSSHACSIYSQKEFQCALCNSEFSHRSTLITHLKTHDCM